MTAYVLKVTLAHIRPPIWRRLAVPTDFRLDQVHDALQLAFGWENKHLHEFKVGDISYGPPDPDDDGDLADELGVTLAELLPRRSSRMEYLYDLGDCWIHTIAVEHIEPLPVARGAHGLRSRHKASQAECLDGARAAPPENCGGPASYLELLEALADESHPRHRERLAWVGPDFDPERFVIADINRRLARA